MEASIGMIIIAVLVIWYLGSSINSILAKAGGMANREFESFEKEQAFRVMKTKEELKIRVKDFNTKSKNDMTDDELKEMLGL